MNKLSFILIWTFCILTSNAQVFVKHDATGANNGTSWQNAFVNLDSAIRQTASGQIWVAKGTYKPSLTYGGGVYTSFYVNKPLALYGGFAGTETNLGQRNVAQNETILSGDIGVAGVDADNTARVVWMTTSALDSSTLIDGFTVTKATYTLSRGFSFDNGGIYLNGQGSPIVRNCFITGNLGSDGGGIYVYAKNAIVTNNIISDNTAYRGAGIFVYYSNATISNNQVRSNLCTGGFSTLSGGGIYVGAYSAPLIFRNIIENNTADFGGGLTNRSNYVIKISNNILSNNSSIQGGGLYLDGLSANITGNLIVNNTASQNGGGIWANYVGSGGLVNNTIANNSAGNYAGALYFTTVNLNAVNNIIYNNSSRYGNAIAISTLRTDWLTRFQYCDIQGGRSGITVGSNISLDSVWRVGNINETPAFIDTANYFFNPGTSSACLNQGNPDTSLLLLSPVDLSGQPRIVDGRIDMGCYENSGAVNTDFIQVAPKLIQVNGWRDSTVNLDILSNINWNINGKPAWLNLSRLQGSGNGAVTATISINPSLNTSRQAKLFLSRTDQTAPGIPIKIVQSKSAHLYTSPDTLFINGNLNDTANFTVNSNMTWFINNYPSWLSFNRYSGSSNTVITAKALLNSTGAMRMGTVIFEAFNTNPVTTFSMVVVQLPAAAILCPGGNTQFTTGLAGATYQWQVNTGSGFVNLQSDTIYGGTNTNTLTMHLVPSSFYGNQYRCMAGNAISTIYSLRFENTWLGSISSEWENPSNWSCGQLPDSGTDVVVNSGTIVLNSNASVRKIMIAPGVSFTISPGANLQIMR